MDGGYMALIYYALFNGTYHLLKGETRMTQVQMHASYAQPTMYQTVSVRQLAPHLLRGETADGTVFFVAHDGGSHALPGNGGLRIKPYANEYAAMRECLSLSQVMTHKHALYGTGFTGAKLVAMAEPQQLNKQALLRAVGQVLNELDGTVYTGCDLNTTLADMTYLSHFCPYVLAAVGTTVDPSAATGYGVFGSISAVCQEQIRGRTFLVHGTGSVGAVVAQLLAQAGGIVLTYDQVAARADLPGCRNISGHKKWWQAPCDVLVPCSISGLITTYIAHRLNCRWVVGSANLPLATAAVQEIFQRRRIGFVPEAISSAGAILCDSVEQYGRMPFAQVQPTDIYHFVQATVQQKTWQLLDYGHSAAAFTPQGLAQFYEAPTQSKAGLRFGAWQTAPAATVLH